MKRGLVVALGGAAIVIAGMSGCSSDNKSSSSSSSSAPASASASPSASVSSGSGSTKVTIDGVDQTVNGSVVCAVMAGNMNIAIGDAATGIAAVISEGDAPIVTSVGLGNVNGVTLGYTTGTGQGEAKAEKNGTTYVISGTATGVDMANPMTPLNKPFEITVTCP